MATTYNTAFGSLPGYNELLGTTNTTGGGQQQTYGQTTQTSTTRPPFQAGQTFAQMQRQGVARPAPPTAPQAQPFAQYGGSQQAQQMRQRLQQQLETYGQTPSRFDTQAFQQIRGAQAANLQQEYRGQLQALNEELARRGLSASSVGGGRMGDLAGQQARALASLDAELLQRAAETQAQDRAQLLSASQGLAELASAQDLAQFEANRVAQAATFENQLRAAQFGQQQFEQMGQEAFQGAQAEEAARQAERQFGLQATGQAAGLSMDLQRLLGQQELERAQLTGQLGGAQTLAAQQQAEQRRQFDIQQALQQQLGLGGLSLEQQRFAEQVRQFGVTSAEEQRQFNIQQALQQQLGLGGLDIQRGQLGVEQQRLIQQGQQFGLQLDETKAARLQQYGISAQELALEAQRVGNQAAQFGQQLSQTERLQQAQNQLEQQKITNQATQFGLQLNEQQAQRVQQGGFTAQELALESQRVANQASQFGQQLSAQERQNAALNNLEQQKITDDRSFRAQQLGLNGRELDIRANQIQQQLAQSGQQITNDQAYRNAELALRTTQIQNENAIAGRQITVDEARIQAQRDISKADNDAQMNRLNAQLREQQRQSNIEQAQFLTQQTGRVWGIDETRGNIPVQLQGLGDTIGALDLRLRQALGMSEATGFVYDPITGQRTPTETVQGQIARSQTLLSLASALGNLTPEQIAQLLGKASPTASPGSGGTTTQSPGSTTPNSGASAGSPPTGGEAAPVGTVFTDRWGWTWVKNSTGWALRSSGTTTTGGDTRPTQPTTTTTPRPDNPTTSTSSPLGPAAPSNVNTYLNSRYPWVFNGMYDNFNDKWYVRSGGTWYESATPEGRVVKDPTNTFDVSAYPGLSMPGPNNVPHYWNGSRWLS